MIATGCKLTKKIVASYHAYGMKTVAAKRSNAMDNFDRKLLELAGASRGLIEMFDDGHVDAEYVVARIRDKLAEVNAAKPVTFTPVAPVANDGNEEVRHVA